MGAKGCGNATGWYANARIYVMGYVCKRDDSCDELDGVVDSEASFESP